MLNPRIVDDNQINAEEDIQITQYTHSEITKDEIKEALRKTKSGKAPGHDQITPDMLKNMGEEALDILHRLINLIWNEKEIPAEWEISVLLPLFKKGDPRDCNNYRGISLLVRPRKYMKKF